MSILDIVLLFIVLLYAFIIFRILVNMELAEKKIESVYKELSERLENIEQKHNSLVDAQASFMKASSKQVIQEVNKEIGEANRKHSENTKQVVEELEYVKDIVKTFLRR